MGVSPGERQDARYVGVTPGERLKCAESGCFPGETTVHGRRIFPGRNVILIVIVLLDDYCIRPALVQFAGGTLHICKPGVYHWIIIV